MDEPLLSVVVPVYNVEKYLDRCLQSITGQSYQNLEVILVDDGSDDRSGAICDSWAEKDSRVQVIHQENRGGGAARNAALDAAQGDLIGFVDSDDYIAPDFYSCLYSLMDERTDIVECGYVETRADDVCFDAAPRLAVRYTREEAMLEHIRDTVFRQLIWNKLYRREMVDGIRFPVGTAIDDEFFTYQTIARARRLVHSDKALYAYRQQDDSIMHRPYSLKRLNGIRAKQRRLEYLKGYMPQLEDEAKCELLSACLYSMQGCLKGLRGAELEEAKNFLLDAAAQLEPVCFPAGMAFKKKILLRQAERGLVGTAGFLNFLIDIHVLT